MSNIIDPIDLTSELIQCKSITPKSEGSLDIIISYLEPLGFKCERIDFGDGTEKVENLYARLGTLEPNIAFAGHVDVVPTGDINNWSINPFGGEVKEGKIWGRGAADTLALLNNRPEGTFKGKDVVLSSGVLNSGGDWDTVRSQVRLLQNRGANSIRLVGAPSNSERFSGYNDQLSSISDELGINFLGGYTPGNDGVHFDYSSSPVYRPLK